jgi:hypothetical protein
VLEEVRRVKALLFQAVRMPPAVPSEGMKEKPSRRRGRKE